MSGLFRQSVNGTSAPRPTPSPIATSESDDHSSSSSDSSASSTDSAASINTVRPSSREQVAPPTHWTTYFVQELYLDRDDEKQKAKYHVYLTPPTDVSEGPLFICHHGAGASGLSFTLFAQHVRRKLPNAGILSLEARGHGSTVTDSSTGEAIVDFSLPTLTADALAMINLTKASMNWPALPPSVLVGHSLGGAIVTQLAVDYALGNTLIGYSVIDVVEGSALEALQHMKTYLTSRPNTFSSIAEAIQWHIRSRTIRNSESAHASVPGLFSETASGDFAWRTDLAATAPYWDEWFTGMSRKFLAGRGAKELILAGTDRLDRELMIGQMQGKFQLVVVPEAGHFVQEDVPEKTAGLLVEFYRRNDRSAMVLPPKVSDLLAQGKKV
ncbi:Protein phosphatase methylesterase 1 [Friedmanniomyces endolithicus]|nr:Protein phosphatase methylesterase 1 [Friedmanniomyces endolithicus]